MNDESTSVQETDDWLKHKLQIEEEEDKLVLAKDANLRKEEDWYEIHDSRNPLNKQRREIDAGKEPMKKRKY